MRRALLWVPVLVYMFLIFHFSSESSPMPEVTERVWDKLLHFIEYGGLAVLLFRAFTGEGLRWLPAAVLAIVTTSGYGASDEFHQAFVPNRSSDIRDWMADTIGATLAIAAWSLIRSYVGSINLHRHRLSDQID
jgi:VanZ family protein